MHAAEVTERARDVAALALAAAREVELAGRLLAPLGAALVDAELCRLLVPGRFGGVELPLAMRMQVSRLLARGCMSTVCCHTVWGVHTWLLAHFDEGAQQRVWRADRAR